MRALFLEGLPYPAAEGGLGTVRKPRARVQGPAVTSSLCDCDFFTRKMRRGTPDLPVTKLVFLRWKKDVSESAG